MPVSFIIAFMLSSHSIRECFSNYVGSKIFKQFSDFRVRQYKNAERRKTLLALSLGVSSLVLLHMLQEHIKRQLERTGRQAYEVWVVHVEESGSKEGSPLTQLLVQIKSEYPSHVYHVCHYEDIFSERHDVDNLAFPESLPQAGEQLQAADRLEAYFNALPSASSVEDVKSIIKKKLIIQKARELGCETILWGDSTTRLAEKSLAETAKGRGFSLPWLMDEGTSAHGVTFKYPLQDLLRREIISFAVASQLWFNKFIGCERSTHKPAVSSRYTTIDELMVRYFGTVEDNYPSIVSNVVKTGGKLRAPEESQEWKRCKLCDLPVPSEALGVTGREGNSEKLVARANERMGVLCYGCCRSVQGSKRTTSQVENFQ